MMKTWEERAAKALVGRTIVSVRYMTIEEVNQHFWYSSALIITLDDGTFFYPTSDDEGNDAGALATSDFDLDVIPVIRWPE